ncbi:MAG: Ig-like domain-containing protein [Bacilli bacterium]
MLHVGYTRCLYLGGNASSQSELDYTFTSSNPSIATVSEYGTVTGLSAGTVEITCVLRVILVRFLKLF